MSIQATEESEAESVEVEPCIYKNEDNTGYPLSSEKIVSGTKRYDVTVEGNPEVIAKGDQKSPMYVTSGSATIKIDPLPIEGFWTNGSCWPLSHDSWGEYNDQTVCGGLTSGKVGNGKIFLQKKTDYGSWTTIGSVMDSAYHEYSVSSDEVNRGTTFRIITIQEYASPYTYEHHYWTTEDYIAATMWAWSIIFIGEGSGVEYLHHYINVCEVYTFQICSSNSSSLLIKNLSVSGIPDAYNDAYADAYLKSIGAIRWGNNYYVMDGSLPKLVDAKIIKPNSIKVVKDSDSGVESRFSSIGDRSLTVTGFLLDNSINHFLKVKVVKDSKEVKAVWAADMAVFCDEGSYTITSTSSSGDSTVYHITVMNKSRIAAFIGESPISYSERAFTYSDHPSYVNSVVLDYIEKPDLGFGIPSLRVEVDNEAVGPGHVIDSLGTHVVTFCWGNPDEGDSLKREYTFDIVEPVGPRINQQNILKSCCPIPSECFGFTLPAGTQSVTFVFESESAARDALVEHERSRVSYANEVLYWSPEGEPAKAIDPVDLEETIDAHVDRLVRKMVLDPSTVVTIENGIEDILCAKLTHPVVVKGQSEFAYGDSLPVLGGKRMLLVEEDGRCVLKESSKYRLIDAGGEGLDCASAMASSEEGIIHIVLDEPLEDQLVAAGMHGLITINEKNAYGRESSWTCWMSSSDDVSIEIQLSGVEYNINSDKSLTGYFPSILSTSCEIPFVFKIWPKGFIQEAELIMPQDLEEKSLAPGEWIIQAIGASGLGWTLDMEVKEVTPSFVWIGYSRVLVSFPGTGENYVAHTTKEVVSEPTCTADGIIKYTAEGSYKGIDYHDTSIETIAKTDHDYQVTCVWAPDGKSVEVEFVCSHDASHCGRFTIKQQDIRVENLGDSERRTVNLVHEGVPVSSSMILKKGLPLPQVEYEQEDDIAPSRTEEKESDTTEPDDDGPEGLFDGIASFFGAAYDALAGIGTFLSDCISSLIAAIGEFFSGLFSVIGIKM